MIWYPGFYIKSNVKNFLSETIMAELGIGSHLIERKIGNVWEHRESSWNCKCICHIINLRLHVFSDCLLNLLWYQILIIRVCSRKYFRNLIRDIRYNHVCKWRCCEGQKKQWSQGSKKLYDSARTPDPAALKQATACKIWGSCCTASWVQTAKVPCQAMTSHLKWGCCHASYFYISWLSPMKCKLEVTGSKFQETYF